MHKQHKQKTILADKFLNKDEKNWQLNEVMIKKKRFVLMKEQKEFVRNYQLECLVTLFCEHCVQNHLHLEIMIFICPYILKVPDK